MMGLRAQSWREKYQGLPPKMLLISRPIRRAQQTGGRIIETDSLLDGTIDTKRTAKLLQWQAGKYAACGLYFGLEDKPDVNYIVPRSEGAKDRHDNWQLFHAHCHHRKSAKDEELRRLEALMSAAIMARSRMRLTSQVWF